MKQIIQLQRYTTNCTQDTPILHSFLSIFSKCFGVKCRETFSSNNYQQQQFFQSSHNPGGIAAVNVHSLWRPQMKCLMVGSLENFADFCFEEWSDCSQESHDSKPMMVMMSCNWHSSYLSWTHIIWKDQIFSVSHAVCWKYCQQSRKTLLLLRVHKSDIEKIMLYADLSIGIGKGDGKLLVNVLSLMKAASWQGCGVYAEKRRSNLRFVSVCIRLSN